VPPNPGLWGGIPLGFEGDRFENLWVMHSSLKRTRSWGMPNALFPFWEGIFHAADTEDYAPAILRRSRGSKRRVRTGPHAITDSDWEPFLDFADRRMT
jgi:hypothetical protein